MAYSLSTSAALSGPGQDAAAALTNARAFLVSAVRDPATIGAIAPSSPALGRLLASVVPSSGEPVVVELGPGTGPVSAAIRERMPEHGQQLAVELDPALVEHLQRTKPWLRVLTGDAGDLCALLAEAEISTVDAMVTSLPWTLFPTEQQGRILDQISQVLTPDGAFTAFTYLQALPMRRARTFRQLLHFYFDEVITTRIVWRNLPPAVTYVCRRPQGHG